MEILEIVIVAGILCVALIYVVIYVYKGLKKSENPCGSCPYGEGGCSSKKKC